MCIRDSFECAREMGFGIAMDDFGTGYSSLGVLKDIPVNLVKIDQTFVRNISQDSFDATFIQFIVRLCHNVGKKMCIRDSLSGGENGNLPASEPADSV